MQPIRLTDDELSAVMRAARPLAPRERDLFLKAVAVAIADLPEGIGPGSIHRAITRVWRQYFDAPEVAG